MVRLVRVNRFTPVSFDETINKYKSSAVAEMGDRLATIDMGRKVGRAAVGECWVPTGSPSNTMFAWAEAYLFTKCHLDPSNRLATTVGMPCSST